MTPPAATDAALSHPPSPAALARLAEALSPDGRVSAVRELRGGLGATMDSFVLRTPDRALRLVLRRYPSGQGVDATAAARRGWRTLELLQGFRVGAPRPIWLDAAGALFGCPALVMTRLPGKTELSPDDLVSWTDELAAALVRVHSVPTASIDCSFLPGPGETAAQLLHLSPEREAAIIRHPDGRATLSALRMTLGALRPARTVLVHGDFWAGNTLSRKGRVIAVVDWDSAAIDSPGLDVGYCRMDLAMLNLPSAPDLFLAAYQRRTGEQVDDLAFWDLLAALRALPNPERWLPGYHGLGRLDVTAEDMQQGLRRFIRAALP